MAEYQVSWKIEVTADNPTEAAMQARMLMLDPESEAVHFEVSGFPHNAYSLNLIERVDLSDVDFTEVAI